MTHSADVLVVGGGVIGLTTAYFLARDGVRVAVVDKGDLGQEASWAGAGILPAADAKLARVPLERLRALSIGMFPNLSAELLERTGIDNGYRRCGGLEVFPTNEPGMKPSREWLGDGTSAQIVDAAEARRLEPNLGPEFAGGAVYLPNMAQVRNPRHLKGLIAACRGLGVTLLPGSAVQSLGVQGGRVREVRTSAGPMRAGQIVLTVGAWTDPLLEPFGLRLGVHPVRGQIVLLQTPLILRLVLLRGERYLVPRDDGRVLIGSTEEDVGFDKRTTAAAIEELLRLASSLVPALAQASVERSWAGLRPGSPDGAPFIGPVAGVENLFVAAGHFRAGIQLSPGTALLLKEMILRQPLTVPIEAFRLDR